MAQESRNLSVVPPSPNTLIEVHNALSGATGTGKTMAAEIMAREMGGEIYRVNFNQSVKRVSERQKKNLTCVKIAEAKRAVLPIDEAETLLEKRMGGRGNHDSLANNEAGPTPTMGFHPVLCLG